MPFTLLMVCEAAERDAANALILAADPEAGTNTFATTIAPLGQPPITHYIANHAGAEDLWLDALRADAELETPAVPSMQWWKISNSNGKLIEKSASASLGTVDELWNGIMFMIQSQLYPYSE